MAYTTGIPAASQLVSQTQQPIQDNFTALVSFGNGYAEMANQITAPTFSSDNDGLYTLNYATTSKNELFVHRQSVDAPTEIPFTASILSNTAMAGSSSGWTYLPSGILIKWGRVAAPGATVSITPTVTSGGPNFNAVFRAFVTPQDGGSAVNFNCGARTAAVAPSGNFTAYCANPSATTAVIYMVIGV